MAGEQPYCRRTIDARDCPRNGSRMRDGVRIVTDLEVRSSRLGLHGRADVVEFHRDGDAWRPYPVEYKKGRPGKGKDADEHTTLRPGTLS